MLAYRDVIDIEDIYIKLFLVLTYLTVLTVNPIIKTCSLAGPLGL
jgi:hypothetical protein